MAMHTECIAEASACFTHAQNPNAKAPFVLEGFNEIWADHVNEMSRYHGTVPALEDFRRVMNRSTYSDSTADSISLRALMENSYGKEAVDYFDNLYREPLSPSLIRRYHYCLTYGTYADQKHQIGIGEYRKNPSKLGVPAILISSKLDELIQSYENKSINMDAILDFHVRFEKVHPFEDYNGRVGRLIMMKECLRHNIVPFIVDDKHRGNYNKGIKCWSTARSPHFSRSAGIAA